MAFRFTSHRARLAVALAVGLVATAAGLVAPAPASGATKIGTSSDGSSSTRKSIKLKRPSKTVVGQVMVAAVVSNDSQPGFSAPAGWMPVRDDSVPGKLRLAVYVKVAGPSEPSSYTWKISGAHRLAGGITTYAGVDTGNPVDNHGASINEARSTEVMGPGVFTSNADLLIHIAAINAEGRLTAPPGMTTRWKAASPSKKNSTDALVSFADAPLTGAGGDTGPRTAIATRPGANIGAVLALRPAPGGPPPGSGPPVTSPPATTPPATGPPPTFPPPSSGGDAVLVGAGDIAGCPDTSGAEATAQLLDRIPGTVFSLGDNAYEDGTRTQFTNCYDPTWGRHKARTAFVAAGNHDYGVSGAAAHFEYFGAAAGDPGRGYYAASVGSWQVIVLNSNCAEVGGCQAGSPQEQWLRSVLARSSAQCTVALFHHPAFSSVASDGVHPALRPFWQALYDYGADVVLVGHDHVYERFGLQDPAGRADAPFGLRQFTVGTGGKSHQSFQGAAPNSEVRNASTYGVLQLTLHAGSYDWQFVPQAGKSFSDQGSTACHGAPGG